MIKAFGISELILKAKLIRKGLRYPTIKHEMVFAPGVWDNKSIMKPSEKHKKINIVWFLSNL